MSPEEAQPNSPVDAVPLGRLEHGPLHRFADYATLTDVIPGSGAGVHTIWDDTGGLVYTGIAGRNPAATKPRERQTQRRPVLRLRRRPLRLPELSGEQIEAIRDSRLSMDSLVREKIHAAFGFRFVVVDDYKTAIQVENLVKSGRLQAGRPRLNPSR
jgi:hypothetical protein